MGFEEVLEKYVDWWFVIFWLSNMMKKDLFQAVWKCRNLIILLKVKIHYVHNQIP